MRFDDERPPTPRDEDYGCEWMVDYLDREDRRHHRCFELPDAPRVNRWLLSHEGYTVTVTNTKYLREGTIDAPMTESAIIDFVERLDCPEETASSPEA